MMIVLGFAVVAAQPNLHGIVFTLTLAIPAGVQIPCLHPFGGENVHRTFSASPPHLPERERGLLNFISASPFGT